ncbi:MAG: DUF11 domain-containing protein [Acidobacteria bacterium]|nr:DUF11 domain-containing protein [Acidobacteriota bacterium]MBI3655394.1 DUF11 domain-containing protein [Acidobacteriota bacterium]
MQFGTRLSQEASLFNGATLSWGIAGSTQNVPIPTNKILQPDLAITKAVSQTTALAGDTLTYTINVQNLITGVQGGGDAINTRIEDTLPTDVTFVPGSVRLVSTIAGLPPQISRVDTTSQPGKVIIFLGNIDADGDGFVNDIKSGSNFNIALDVKVNADLSACKSITNGIVIIIDNTDVNFANNQTFSPPSTICPLADVAIAKVCPADVVSGTDITYTLNYNNNGPSPAQAVSIVDTLPAGVTFVSASAGGTFDATTGKVTFAIGTLASGATGSATITVHVTATSGTLTNSAAISTSTQDSNPANNTSSCTSTVGVADVAVTKVCPATALTGSTIAYTLNYSNQGTAAAQNVTLVDTLPAGVTFVSATAPAGVTFTQAPGSVTFTIGTLAAGANGTATVSVMVNVTGGDLLNTAKISTTTAETVTSNNTSTCTTSVTAADVTITKSAPATVISGNDLTYTLNYKNQGNAAAENVKIVDTLPAGVTFKSATAQAGVTFTQAAGVVTFTVGTLAAGATGTATITVTVNTTTTGGTLINNVEISTTTPESNPNNNKAQASTDVLSADVTITKSAPLTVISGNDLTYTLNYKNQGTAPAENVKIVDTLPPVVTFKGATAPAGVTFTQAAGVVTFTVGTLAAGATGAATVTVTVNTTTTGGTLINNVEISTTTPESNANNNKAQASTDVLSADVTITKNAPTTVVTGSDMTFTLNYSNLGTAPAENVKFVDTLPPGVTFKGGTAPAGVTFTQAAGVVTFTVGTLAPAATGSATITVTVNLSTTGGNLINNVEISTTTPESNPNNNKAQTTTAVLSADVTIVKSAPLTVISGNDLTYTLNFSNQGTAPADNVKIVDTMPAGVTFVSASPSGVFDVLTGTVTFAVGALLPGGSGTASITVTVNRTTTGGTLINNVEISTTTPESNPNNNKAQTTTAVLSADVTIAKSAPLTIVSGSDLTYTINYSNQGTAPADNVKVVDTLPPGVTFKSATAPAGVTFTQTAGVVTFTVGTLAAGATGSATITVTVNTTTTGGALVNNVEISTTTPESNPNNNKAQASTDVMSADVTLNKSAPATVVSGSDLTYTINYSNLGSAAAENVKVVDTLPAGVTFKSATAPAGVTFAQAGGTVTFTVGTLAAGGAGSVTITVTVNRTTTGGTLTNNVEITTTTPESNPNNNKAQATTSVLSADVTIAKVCPATVTAGTDATYTLNFGNTGSAPAVNVTIVDTLPVGVNNVRPGPGGTFDPVTGKVTFNIGTLTPGSAGLATITVNITATSGSLSNTAEIFTDTPEPNIANNKSACSSAVLAADAAVTKSGVEVKVKYSVVAKNLGTAPANNVVLTDTLPAGMTFVPGESTPAPTSVAGQTLTYNVGTLAPAGSPGDQASFTIVTTVNIPPTGLLDLTTLQNKAHVSTSSAESLSGNNDDSVTITIQLAKP